MIFTSVHRPTRIGWPQILLATALFAAFCSAGVCAIVYRVTLTDGTVLENATVSQDREFLTVTLKTDSLTRTVSYSMIESIQNTAGEDVTADFLGDKRPKAPAVPASPPPGPAQESPTPADAPDGSAEVLSAPSAITIDVARHHPWDAALRWGGNFSIPLGDFYEGIGAGIGFEADGAIRVGRQLAIRAVVSKSGMRDSFEDDFPGYRVVRDDLSLTAMRYLIGVEYFDWPHWRSGGKTMYYVYTGLGAVSHSFSGNLILEEKDSGEQFILTSDDRDITRFMTATDFGAVIMLNRSVGLDVSAEFGVVYVGKDEGSNSVYGSIQYGYILDFRLGLVTIF